MGNRFNFMKYFSLFIIISNIIISCNKNFTTEYIASYENKDAILYSEDLPRHINLKEKYETGNLSFLDSCRKKSFENSIFEYQSFPCQLELNKQLKDIIFMVGDPSFDSIVKAEFIEEKVLDDSTSYIIINSENKNSKGYYAGNSELMKILIIKSNNNLKSISKIYSSYTDGFHLYEKSILQLEDNLYQLNDYIFEFPPSNYLQGFSVFKITDEGFIEVLSEKDAQPYKQKVIENVNALNSKN